MPALLPTCVRACSSRSRQACMPQLHAAMHRLLSVLPTPPPATRAVRRCLRASLLPTSSLPSGSSSSSSRWVVVDNAKWQASSIVSSLAAPCRAACPANTIRQLSNHGPGTSAGCLHEERPGGQAGANPTMRVGDDKQQLPPVLTASRAHSPHIHLPLALVHLYAKDLSALQYQTRPPAHSHPFPPIPAPAAHHHVFPGRHLQGGAPVVAGVGGGHRHRRRLAAGVLRHQAAHTVGGRLGGWGFGAVWEGRWGWGGRWKAGSLFLPVSLSPSLPLPISRLAAAHPHRHPPGAQFWAQGPVLPMRGMFNAARLSLLPSLCPSLFPHAAQQPLVSRQHIYTKQ